MAHTQVNAAELLKIVEHAREEYARDLFDIARVAGLMKDRAAKGYGWVQVEQNKPLRLEGTRAAGKLIGWLARGGCRIDWREMPAREGDPMLRHYQHAELCIYWTHGYDQISLTANTWLQQNGETSGLQTVQMV